MKRASISDAKNRLSALIDGVRHGEAVIIEDRGVPVARLESVAARPAHAAEGRLARLERQGIVRPAVAAPPLKRLGRKRPKPAKGVRASDLLIAERREGR